ncbi:hypothetical protein V8043_002879 [Vibrio vulnificus]
MIQELFIKLFVSKAMSAKSYQRRFRNRLSKPYALILCHGDEPIFLIEDVDLEKGIVVGVTSENGEFRDFCGQKAEIKLSELESLQLKIEHVIKNRSLLFSSVFNFLFNKITNYRYILLYFAQVKSNRQKRKFETTKLILKSRIALLEYLVEHHCRGEKPMTLEQIMSATVNNRWVFYHDSKHKIKRLSLMLESLKITQDIEVINNNRYQVSPKAILTIEAFRDDKLKHSQLIVIQKGMLLLTVTLAFFAALQSGLIKLANIIELENQTGATVIILLVVLGLIYFVNKSHNKQFKSDS